MSIKLAGTPHASCACAGRHIPAKHARQAPARSWKARRSLWRQWQLHHQPAPQRSRLQAVRACVRAVRIGAENREGGGCGGGFPAGGAGGAGRRTAASLPPVSIATSGAVGAAAAAVSSAPLWRGGDQSARWRRKRRARGERGVGTDAPASPRGRLPARPVGPFVLPLPNEVLFLPISRDQRGAVWRRNGAQLQILNRQASPP